MKIYPFATPEGAHPLAWTLYGFGLDAATINKLCEHLFDQLGARLATPEPREVTLSWAVDWPLDVDSHERVSVRDELNAPLGFATAATLIDGALPPGIRIIGHTGRLAGTFSKPGLYTATFRLAPKVKYDPLGGPGGPDTAGKWIPLDQPRQTPPAGEAPVRQIEDMDLHELEDVIIRAKAAQRAKAIWLAERGTGGD